MSKEKNPQIKHNVWTLTLVIALVCLDYDVVVSESINYGYSERDQSLISNDFKNKGDDGGVLDGVHAHEKCEGWRTEKSG